MKNSIFFLLAFPVLIFAAPRLKPRPEPTLEELVAAHWSSKPWVELEKQVERMTEEEWVRVGKRVSELARIRLAEQGIDARKWLSPFESKSPNANWTGFRRVVALDLCDLKWYEFRGLCTAERAPKTFWDFAEEE